MSNASYPIGTLRGFVINRCSWVISQAVVEIGGRFQDNAILVSRDKLVSSAVSEGTLIIPIGSKQSMMRDGDTQSLYSDPSVTKLEVSVSPPGGWALARPMPLPSFPTPMVSSFYVTPECISPEVANGVSEICQSGRDLIGREVQAKDGRVGSVDDLLLDDDTWSIRFVVVDTGRWFSDRKVILLASWLEQDSGNDSPLALDMSADDIKNGSDYDPDKSTHCDIECELVRYYGATGATHSEEHEDDQ